MKLDEDAIIVFKNDEGEKAEITVSIQQLLDYTTDDFLEMLEDSQTCTCSSCNNENQNFCDCDSIYENYKISEVIFPKK